MLSKIYSGSFINPGKFCMLLCFLINPETIIILKMIRNVNIIKLEAYK